MTGLRETRERLDNDHGMAMIPVLGVAMSLLLLLGVAAHDSHFTLKLSRRSQDVHAALQAAEAAVGEYVHRLNADPSYIRYAHVPATGCPGAASTVTLDPANPFMSPELQPLPGGAGDVAIRYTIDVSRLCSKGHLTVTAYGKVSQIERSMTYTVKRRGFADYAYFSDLEVLNPAKYPDTHPWVISGDLDRQCDRRHYEPSKPHPTTGEVLPPPRAWENGGECAMVNWLTNDRVHGPLHTNDALLVCGEPRFWGKTTSSWVGDGTRRYLMNPGCTNDPSFWNNYEKRYCTLTQSDVCYDEPLQLPTGVQLLKSVPGACIYTGPTRIRLNGNHMEVWSPNTSGGCGTGWVPQPARGVVYVQPVPEGTVEQPCPHPAGWVNPQNGVGFPREAADITTYSCRSGDLFVENGTYKSVTLVAENRLVVTSSIYPWRDTTRKDVVIGFVSGGDIEIYHPVDASGANLLTSPVRTIYAAMLAPTGSLTVQNYDKGAHLGRLWVYGAISQKWRGLVGTTDQLHGYAKRYYHEDLLHTIRPPHFPAAQGGRYEIAGARS